MSDFTGSNITELLELLTAGTGVDNVIGQAEDARASSSPRIVWVPPVDARETYAQPVHQPDDGHACLTANETYEVHAWASDFAGAQELRNKLLKALCEQVSEGIFKLAAGRYVGGAITAPGWMYVVQASIQVPIYDRKYRRATIANASASDTLAVP